MCSVLRRCIALGMAFMMLWSGSEFSGLVPLETMETVEAEERSLEEENVQESILGDVNFNFYEMLHADVTKTQEQLVKAKDELEKLRSNTEQIRGSVVELQKKYLAETGNTKLVEVDQSMQELLGKYGLSQEVMQSYVVYIEATEACLKMFAELSAQIHPVSYQSREEMLLAIKNDISGVSGKWQAMKQPYQAFCAAKCAFEETIRSTWQMTDKSNQEALDELRTKREMLLEEIRLAEQKEEQDKLFEEIKELNVQIEIVEKSLACEIGEVFKADMQAINNLVYQANAAAPSYLTELGNVYRQTSLSEDEVMEALTQAYDSAKGAQLLMLALYSQYCECSKIAQGEPERVFTMGMLEENLAAQWEGVCYEAAPSEEDNTPDDSDDNNDNNDNDSNDNNNNDGGTGESDEKSAIEVRIKTANEMGAGTDAHITMRLQDENGNYSPDISLTERSNQKHPFEKGNTDIISLAISDLGEATGKIKAVQIKTDHAGWKSDWKLESIAISGCGNSLSLVENHWFEEGKDDNQYITFGEADYTVTVKTADVTDAGTDAKIKIQLVDENGNCSPDILPEVRTNQENPFEQGQTDKISLLSCDLGEATGKICSVKIKIDHNGSGSDWMLDSISVSGGDTDFTISAGYWFFDNKDGKQEIEISNSEDFCRVKLKTADKVSAGTNANITMRLEDENGNYSSDIPLNVRSNQEDSFEKGQTDTIALLPSDMESITGNIKAVQIKSDCTGWNSDWKLNSIDISGCGKTFKTDGKEARWFEENRDDNQYITFGEADYQIAVKTANRTGAGTDAKITMKLLDENGNYSPDISLTARSNQEDPFEKGQTDTISLLAPDLGKATGKIVSVYVKSDHAGNQSDWMVGNITIQGNGNNLKIPTNYWFLEDSNDKEYRNLSDLCYIKLTTADKFGAGTDADISMCLVDENNNSSPVISLSERSDHKNAFERDQTDTISVAKEDLGEATGQIYGVNIKFNSKGVKPDWKLESIQIRGGGTNLNINANRWFEEDVDDNKYIPFGWSDYSLTMKTADNTDAGTDANIIMQLVDENGNCSKEIPLNKRSDQEDPFQQGQIDTISLFTSDLGDVTGKISYVKIKLDHAGEQSDDWLLENFEVRGYDTEWAIYANQLFTQEGCKEEETDGSNSDSYITFGGTSKNTFLYHVVITTQIQEGAELSSADNAKIKLNGSNGQSTEWIYLEDYLDAPAWQKGNAAILNVYSDQILGEVTGITVHIGADDVWDIMDIEVTEILPMGEKMRRYCNVDDNSIKGSENGEFVDTTLLLQSTEVDAYKAIISEND